jgi:formamidopyrimidine-DNA glycosylase
MPELPEVQTTVNGLNKYVKGLTIKSVWSDTHSLIKSMTFEKFEKEIIGKKIERAERRGKNVLINLSGNLTLRVHLKMTGHLMHGTWKQDGNNWQAVEPESLKDPFNRFLHIVFRLSDGKYLALSDLRKFAKVELFDTGSPSKDLVELGPEPLSAGEAEILDHFNFKTFYERLMKKPRGKMKQVLMDQTIISGIGNIYSDEILWEAGIHPLSQVAKIPEDKIHEAYNATKKILTESLEKGGDSMTDYRNILGAKGRYQENHRAYHLTGNPCKRNDGGKIQRMKIGGRSGHFCPVHQNLYN